MKRKRAASVTRRRTRKFARVATVVGIEKKFIDYEFDATIVKAIAGSEADPATDSISAIAQGDGESNRDGRKCTLVSVQCQGYIELTSQLATDPLAATVRLCVIHDKQTNGAQLNAEDVFADPTDTDLDPLAFRNLQFAARFQVIWDKTFVLAAPAGGGDAPTPEFAPIRRYFKLFKKLNLPVVHNAVAAAIASITDNSLHVLAFSGANDAATTLRYISRVRFLG